MAAAVEEDGGAGADVVGRGGVVVDAGFVLRQRDVARGAAAVGDGYDAHGGFAWGEGGVVGLRGEREGRWVGGGRWKGWSE